MTKTILLADDSVTIQKVIELTFMDEDYEVATAGNGEEALERLEEITPDVVIADVHMPGASGFDVAKRSKQLHPDTPVLLLVGTFEPFDEADYQASGADSYLKKPFDSQELLQRVGSLLEAAPAAAAAPAAEQPAVQPEPSASPRRPPSRCCRPSRPTRRGGGGAGPGRHRPGGDRVGRRHRPADAAGRPGRHPCRARPGRPGGGAADGGGDRSRSSAARAAGSQGDDQIFSGLGFGEGDGSSEVPPPPDLVQDEDGGSAAWAAPAAPAPAAPSFGAAPEASREAADEVTASGVPAPAPAAATAAAGLSDADVDRIARRVVELLGDGVLREVAWEVVPDLAEVVIKDRLAELESQAVESQAVD